MSPPQKTRPPQKGKEDAAASGQSSVLVRDWKLFLERLGRGQNQLVAYGWAEVRLAAELGAVQSLFCPEADGEEDHRTQQLQREELQQIIKQKRGRYHLVVGRPDDDRSRGRRYEDAMLLQLRSFGVAALLRFPIEEALQDDERTPSQGSSSPAATKLISGCSAAAVVLPQGTQFQIAALPCSFAEQQLVSVHDVPTVLFPSPAEAEALSPSARSVVTGPDGGAADELEALQAMFTENEIAVRGNCVKLLLRSGSVGGCSSSDDNPTTTVVAPPPSSLLVEFAVPGTYPKARPCLMLSEIAAGHLVVGATELQLSDLRTQVEAHLCENEGEKGMLLGAWWVCQEWLASLAAPLPPAAPTQLHRAASAA